jgi:fructose-bisphosphate aldolase class II
VPIAQRAALAATSHICKFNIGTELRMVFGSALRAALARDHSQFDRIEILRATEAPMTAAAQAVIRNLGAHSQVEAAG